MVIKGTCFSTEFIFKNSFQTPDYFTEKAIFRIFIKNAFPVKYTIFAFPVKDTILVFFWLSASGRLPEKQKSAEKVYSKKFYESKFKFCIFLKKTNKKKTKKNNKKQTNKEKQKNNNIKQTNKKRHDLAATSKAAEYSFWGSKSIQP